jgi:hypothetical protein
MGEDTRSILGITGTIGTIEQIFHPLDLRRGFGHEWFRRKLSSDDIASLMSVDRTTVSLWRKKGWLKGKCFVKKVGWRKVVYWRHSLGDLEACILKMSSRKQGRNPVEHKCWTPQELELCRQGICPEYRSRRAFYIMRSRQRKKGII